MNWYKYKFAFPILEKRNPFDTYEDFRHEGDDPNYVEQDISLWFIDTSFGFHITKPTPEQPTHFSWDEFKDLFFQKQIIYQGRFDEKTHKVSMTKVVWSYVNPAFEQIYRNREDKLREKAERILDKKFNNPTILVF